MYFDEIYHGRAVRDLSGKEIDEGNHGDAEESASNSPSERIHAKDRNACILPLGVCGVCMGLGIACKWTGVYAGIGLPAGFRKR